jgi:3-deoxy-manno-octulosonate cytidylyltransferase (CMP-KDO synthetase)
MKKVIIIIPARFASTRYPGKPLAKILGREMILRVADICKNVVRKKNLFIATEDNKIAKIVKKNGYNCLFTSKKCLTGTDRVAEVSKKISSKIYVNVQGDEPLLNPRDIKKIIKEKIKYPNHVVCGFDKINKVENPKSNNIPKVTLNLKRELMYISRSLIPGMKNNDNNFTYAKQVCIYAFNKKELGIFGPKAKKSKLEKIEDIEILRCLENSIKVKMVKLNGDSIAVDRKSDIQKVVKLIKKKI